MSRDFKLGRTKKETLDEFWDEVHKNERLYHEECIRIVAKNGKLVNFKLRPPQEVNESYYQMCQAHSIPIRLLESKYRQLGNTTYWSGVIHRRIMSRRNHIAHIVAHRKNRVKKVLRLQKSFIKHLPAHLRPEIETDNQESLILSDRGSQVSTSSATDPEGIRGDTIHDELLTEAAYYGDKGGSFKALLTSGLEAVPEPHVLWDTMVVAESTGNGQDEEFCEFYTAAEAGENSWIAKFLVWFDDPECEMSFHVDPLTKQCVHLPDAKGSSLVEQWAHLRALRDNCKVCHQLRMNFKGAILEKDADLNGRKARFGLNYEQCHFYWTKLMKANGDRLKIQQEYPCTWQESFIASGTPVFDVQLLTRIKDHQKPGKLYELPMDCVEFKDMTPNSQLRRGKEPYVEVWAKPDINKTYVIPADSSEGKEKSNPSSALVYELESMRIVAELHGRIEPDPYGDYLMRLGNMYNVALLGPERQYSGVAVLNKILQDNYPNLYQKHRLTAAGWEETDTPGWDTNVQTKPWIIGVMRNLLHAFRDNPEHLAHLLPSAALIDDMMKFTRGKMQTTRAKYGSEDDRVMAAMIGLGICHQELGLGLGEQLVSGVVKTKKKDPAQSRPEKKKVENVDYASHKRQMAKFMGGSGGDDDDSSGIVGDFDDDDDDYEYDE